jgi:hypothetical protein
MSNSPFSKPPIPAFAGIAGKIQMALTVKALIDGKKDFVDSIKNAAKVKAMQKANELKDAAIKKAREEGESAVTAAKKRREEATAKANAVRASAAAKSSELTATSTAAVTSAKSVRSAAVNDPKIKKLQSQFDKLKSDIANARTEEVAKTKEFNDTLAKFNKQPAEATLAEVKSSQSKMQSAGVTLRELSSRASNKGLELTNELRNITG